MFQANFVVMVHCSRCNDVHVINFRSKTEFENAKCNETGEPVFCTRKDSSRVYREIQEDALRYAVAI